MIKITHPELAAARADDLRHWLDSTVRLTLSEVVEAKIATLQAEAMNAAVPDPCRELLVNDAFAMTEKARDLLKQAALWQVFQKKLRELTEQQSFQLVQLEPQYA